MMSRRDPDPRPRFNRVGADVPFFGLFIGLFCVVLTAATLAATKSGWAAPRTAIFFNIGTGSVAGSYFRIGDLIASIISHPPGSVRCTETEACGPEGLIAVARASEGSVYNVRAVNAGLMESALAQANVAQWAVEGLGPFKKAGPQTQLRTIANLYPEAIHLVARTDAEIQSVKDLKGKRVSIDRKGSGTYSDALMVLKAVGLKPDTVTLEYLDPDIAAERIGNGTLDAFFYTVGAPVKAIQDLAIGNQAMLVPLNGPEIDALQEKHLYLVDVTIDQEIYGTSEPVETLGVGALWIVHQNVDEALVYSITKALWDENNKALLEGGHPLGAQITLAHAEKGSPLDLHAGAKRFYDERRRHIEETSGAQGTRLAEGIYPPPP